MSPSDADGLISLAAVTWGFALRGRSRMLTEAWHAAGHSPVFVPVPSPRTALERLLAKVRTDDGFQVIHPWPACPRRWWPYVSEARLRRLIRPQAKALRKRLERLGPVRKATAVVVSPVWTPWLESLPFKRVVYDCIDTVSVHVPRPELAALFRQWETELIERAAGAVVTAEPLAELLRNRRPDLPVATIRNGVDVEQFRRAASSSPPPADLPRTERPIVGFVGALYEWIDWRLIAQVVRKMPHCDFVFVGPRDSRDQSTAAAAEVSKLPNTRFLGRRPYEQVPAYVNAFDVCWVPFDGSAVSKSANPVKIYEYLALGKPVVSTPVADTDSFDGHVAVGGDADEIEAHLRSALSAEDDEAAGAARIAFARANSWNVRAGEFADFVRSLDRTAEGGCPPT